MGPQRTVRLIWGQKCPSEGDRKSHQRRRNVGKAKGREKWESKHANQELEGAVGLSQKDAKDVAWGRVLLLQREMGCGYMSKEANK